MSATTISSQIKIYDKFDKFDQEVLRTIDEDETVIINFWATWCKPCVKELPYFEELTKSGKYKVILVSLDFKVEGKLLPYVKDKQLQSEVIALTDSKYNNWIDKVSTKWSGSIPATLFIKNGKKRFVEKSYHSSDEIINDLTSF